MTNTMTDILRMESPSTRRSPNASWRTAACAPTGAWVTTPKSLVTNWMRCAWRKNECAKVRLYAFPGYYRSADVR